MDITKNNPALQQIINTYPYPLLFVTVSGSHAYGFSSPNSDIDLRGVHNLPVESLLGLKPERETYTRMMDEPDLDIQTHDIRKFIHLLLKKNGTMLEVLRSPLVLYTSPFHEQLRALVPQIVTRNHAYHYNGFAIEEGKRLAKLPRVKSLVYLFRILLTGTHLMQTGEVEMNLATLGELHHMAYIPSLIAMKQAGAEKAILTTIDQTHYDKEIGRLRNELWQAHEESTLPEAVSEETKQELNYLLLRCRGIQKATDKTLGDE